ncbi:TPA: hypothetical protein ACWKQY_005322, partial [Escherichia coli]
PGCLLEPVIQREQEIRDERLIQEREHALSLERERQPEIQERTLDGMVIRDRLKCCQRVSGAFFGIMVGSGAPGTRFSQTLLKTQERVKTHTGAILVCLLLLCFASIARSRSFP